MRCWHAFEHMCVLANGDVACSICDGRADFVLGSVFEESPTAIFNGPRYRTLRQLMLQGDGPFCPATGRDCLLKDVEAVEKDPQASKTARSLQIEPTTACNLRCLTCLVRDIQPVRGQGWDGDLRFRLWDRARRTKQGLAPILRQLPGMDGSSRHGPLRALLARGRMRDDRGGILPLPIIEAVIDDLHESLERIDFFNYGEPFLYPHLVDALRHVRRRCPGATIAISTNGIPITEATEEAIISEGLVDWILFSIDGVDPDTYAFYRAGGSFRTAWNHLLRFHHKAQSSGVHVVWQNLVFRWNDTDRELETALELAEKHELTLWLEFVRTWGRSKRRGRDLAWLRPFLKPGTSLPAS